jgi:hypothetical protein
MPLDEGATEYAASIAGARVTAHLAGIIQRDLKPGLLNKIGNQRGIIFKCQ